MEGMSPRKTLLLCFLLSVAWLASSAGSSRARGRDTLAEHGGETARLAFGVKKGAWPLLCEAPFGPFRQKGPDPFFDGGDEARDKLPDKNVLRRFGTVRFRTGDGILSLAYSPNGKILASGGRNDPVRLWDAESGELLRRLNEPFVWALAFSPDGKYLATAGANKIVRLWDAGTGKEIVQMKGHKATVKSLAFSNDGKVLASGSDDNTVRLWNVADGTEVAVYSGHTLGVNAVKLSPDSKYLASGSTDRTIRVVELGNKTTVLHTPAAVTAIAYLPDRNTLIAAGDDGFLRIWDIATGRELRRWKGHDNSITHVLLGQDGNTLATAGLDKTVRLWDVAKGTLIRKIVRNAGDGDAMALSPDSNQVAVGGLNNTIRRWDTTTGKPLGGPVPPEGAVTAVACSSDGKLAAAGFTTNQVVLFDLASGKERTRLVCGPEDAEVLLAFSEGGKTLATASTPDTIILWNVATGKERLRMKGEGGEIRCLACSPDGLKMAAAYTTDRSLHIWETSANNVVHKVLPMPRGVWALAYSLDSKQLAVASDDVLVVHQTGSYQVIRQFNKLNDTIACLAFAPDCRTLAAGTFAGTIGLFDLSVPKGQTEVQRRVLEGHRGVVNALSWSINGRCLVSAGFDNTVCLWEFVNGLPIASWHGHNGEATAVAFHPSGRTVLSGSRDTTLLLWDVMGFSPGGKLPQKQLDVAALDVLWRELGSNNNLKGNEALWTLVSAKDSASYLSRKVFLVDPQKIKQYLLDLNSNTFKVREKAFAALASYERWIEGILKETSKDPPSEEVRQRVAVLLQRLASRDAVTLEQERLRARRVIEILEQTATPAARELLRGLAAGAAEDDLRAMAQAVLERVGKQ